MKNNMKKFYKFIKKSAKNGNVEAMYECGRMLFCVKGCKANEEKSIEYFNLLKTNGFEKSKQFLIVFQKFNDINDFNTLDNEINLLLISQVLKNDYFNEKKLPLRSSFLSRTSYIWKRVNIKFKNAERLLNNNNIKVFIEVLVKFENSFIHLVYPPETVNLLAKQSIKYPFNVIISVFLSKSIVKIEHGAFQNISIILEIDIPLSVVKIKSFAFCNTRIKQITILHSIKFHVVLLKFVFF